jgi:hypothetical protein
MECVPEKLKVRRGVVGYSASNQDNSSDPKMILFLLEINVKKLYLKIIKGKQAKKSKKNTIFNK